MPSKFPGITLTCLAVKEKAPGPGAYTPLTNLNENHNSLHKAMPRARFGTEERKSLIEESSRRLSNVPGPGWYTKPSEFGSSNNMLGQSYYMRERSRAKQN